MFNCIWVLGLVEKSEVLHMTSPEELSLQLQIPPFAVRVRSIFLLVCAPFFSLQSPNPLARSLATLYYDFAPPFKILRDTNARPFRRVIIICRQPRRY